MSTIATRHSPSGAPSDHHHEKFDSLSGEQQDHLFDALCEARAAADEY